MGQATRGIRNAISQRSDGDLEDRKRAGDQKIHTSKNRPSRRHKNRMRRIQELRDDGTAESDTDRIRKQTDERRILRATQIRTLLPQIRLCVERGIRRPRIRYKMFRTRSNRHNGQGDSKTAILDRLEHLQRLITRFRMVDDRLRIIKTLGTIRAKRMDL